MLRSKPDGRGGLEHNSYKSSDAVNSIKWFCLDDPMCADTYRYYQGLLAFRKAYANLRLATRKDVLETISPIPCSDPHVVAFRIHGKENSHIISVFNASFSTVEFPLPAGKWNIFVNGCRAGTHPLAAAEGRTFVEPLAALILVKE